MTIHDTAINSTFVGKKTPKGLVVREISRGACVGQWFVPDNGRETVRMDVAGRGFFPCQCAREAERVEFFARRFEQA